MFNGASPIYLSSKSFIRFLRYYSLNVLTIPLKYKKKKQKRKLKIPKSNNQKIE